MKEFLRDKQADEKCTLHNVSGSAFIDEIHKEMDKYIGDHSMRDIITCDVDDVFEWLRKAENKVIKKHCKLIKK